MQSKTIYLIAKRHVVVEQDTVQVGDIASVFCEDSVIQAKVRAIKVYQFHEKKEPRCVIGILRVIELINELYPNLTVESLGETNTIIKSCQLQQKENKWLRIKMIFICLICFIGTAFTIMAFHNDIGITGVFSRIYWIVTREETTYHTELELSYSIGLAIGILLFYNRFQKRTVAKDPTPLSVEMRVYETEVDQAIIEMAEREDTLIDVGHK